MLQHPLKMVDYSSHGSTQFPASTVSNMALLYLGKFHHDLTVLPNPGIIVRIREIIPFYGRKIQVRELL